MVNSAKRAERGTKKWERVETCSRPAFSLPLLSPPRSLPLFFAVASLFCSFPYPHPLQGSLVSGYFPVNTTTPWSPTGTTPVIRPRLVSRQIRKGSHGPLYFISVLSPFSTDFFSVVHCPWEVLTLKGLGREVEVKFKLEFLKLELSLFAPPRSLTTPLTNSCLFPHTPRIILLTKHVSRDCTVFIMVMFMWNSFSSGPYCVFVQLCVIWTFFLVS